MSDPFFQKKRKRGPSASGPRSSGPSRSATNGRKKVDSPSDAAAGAGPSRMRMRDRAKGGRRDGGDDDDDDGDENDEEGIEGMDTLHRYDHDLHESDEEQDETPAEARVRLAQLYLESLRDEAAADGGDGAVDAQEIDRANIASRLQADAAQHSTHMHTFVADRIRIAAADTHGGAVLSSTDHILACRGHRLSVTSAVVSHDCSSLWTAGKDGRIIHWRLRDGKMLEMINKGRVDDAPLRSSSSSSRSSSSGAARRRARTKAALAAAANGETLRCQLVVPENEQGHHDEVWTLSTTYDGKYLVSGGKDRRICVWSAASAPGKNGATSAGGDADSTTSFVKALGGHKDGITALRFRQGTYDLFSASLDRTMKLFDISQLSYVETFFGHQEDISSMDVLRAELVVTAGSRDRTVRWWKVRDESQLVFRGGGKSKVREVLEGGDVADEGEGGADDVQADKAAKREQTTQRQALVEGSIDAVAMVDEHTFLSGGDTGTISLWSLAKKKPIFSVPAAHGFDDAHEAQRNGGVASARWITSLACLPYGDVFASGSWDGRIRLWKLSSSLKSFSLLLDVPVAGFVNSLQLVHPTRAIVKRRGGSVLSPEQWRRHGGMRGGAKKVFADEEDAADAAPAAIPTAESKAIKSSSSSDTLLLVAAIGQEPVRGRWQKVNEARNGTLVVPFHLAA